MTNNTGSTVILVSPKKLACTIYSLHDDLLLAIFLCCNQARFSFDEEDDFNSLSIQTSPWVLSHVCQRWRVLVVSAPLLWTTILLPMECFPVDPSGVISRLETVLQRSGDLELNVEIEDVHWSAPYHVYDDDAEERWNEERWNKSRTCVHSLIRLLLPTTVRWRHLIIFSSHDVFEALAGCSFGALQSLSIRDSCEDREDHEEDLSVTLFREAPKLRELKLGNNVGIDIHRGGIQTFTTESNGLLFLPGMQSLEALHIEEVNEDSQMLDQVRQNLGVFELPSLRTITVHEVIGSPVAYELSSHLRVTALKTLALLIWNRFGPALLPHPLPAFDNLDSLVNLSIDFVEFDSPDTTSFLACASSVTNVYLGARVATPAVMEAIGAGLLPKMQTLGLNFSMMERDTDAIISMLNRRAHPITILTFARYRPYQVPPKFQNDDGWLEWSSRKERGLEEDTSRWVMLRENIDVQIVEGYSFELSA